METVSVYDSEQPAQTSERSSVQGHLQKLHKFQPNYVCTITLNINTFKARQQDINIQNITSKDEKLVL